MTALLTAVPTGWSYSGEGGNLHLAGAPGACQYHYTVSALGPHGRLSVVADISLRPQQKGLAGVFAPGDPERQRIIEQDLNHAYLAIRQARIDAEVDGQPLPLLHELLLEGGSEGLLDRLARVAREDGARLHVKR